MDKIQIAFFFISGFFISRLLIKAKIPEQIVNYFLDNKHAPPAKITFYLVFLSAGLSFFIPNVITVLTLIPVINVLLDAFNKANHPQKKLPTLFTLAVMYGANIGGMGSITATPANGILVAFLGINNVPGSESLTFANWLVWGIPLVIIFSSAAALILILFFGEWKLRKEKEYIDFDLSDKAENKSLILFLTASYFLTSIIFSVWMFHTNNQIVVLIFTVIYTLTFIGFIFFVPVKNKLTEGKAVLLQIKDCYSNLPVKGFIFVGISIAVAGILYALNLQDKIAEIISRFLPSDISVLIILLILALLTSFSTELLSNTAVQFSLFVIILPFALLNHFSPVESLLVITLSSTCAFMSPIATGVNGLAFGGVKGISLKSMLWVGLLVNLTGAIIISLWVHFVAGNIFPM